jgi:hypothetical protein
MERASNENTGNSRSWGAQHNIPRDAEELHNRAYQFMSAVGPTLNSVESLLDTWTRFREVSKVTTGLPEKSSFRTVKIDPFTVRQPPPSVSEAEITQYISKLSKDELKALNDEYELMCLEDFEYVQADEGKTDMSAQMAARIVHFVSEIVDADEEEGGGDPAKQQARLSVSPTSRATALFEGNATSVEALRVKPDGHLGEVFRAEPPPTPPIFSLVQMSSSAMAAHERGSDAAPDSSYPFGLPSQLPTTAEAHPRESYTVEIEYSADHFIPSSIQRTLCEGAGGAVRITPGVYHMPQVDTPLKTAPPLQSDGDGEENTAEANIQSFTTFSRIVLANEGCRLKSQRAEAETQARTEKPQHADSAHGENAPSESRPAVAGVPSSLAPPAAATITATSSTTKPSAAPTNAVSVKVRRNADPASARDAFVRQRVRDILIANCVRAADAAALGAAFFEKLDSAWNDAANRTTPVLHKLENLLCESSALLHTLEVMDHKAYRERVMNPAQYLCVPRYSVTCAAPDCNAAFSTTTTRVMCGRCGGFFCPACCAERGLGPDAMCNGQRYSLGWEPLCRLCYQTCRDSQQTLVEQRTRQLLLTDAASHCDPAEVVDDEAEEARRASVDSLTLKQAVLFGAYCDEEGCLSDGLPPFYVMDCSANEGVAFWDVLRYRFAKTRGSFRRGLQSAGKMTTQAMQSVAQMVSARRATLR